MNRRAGAWTARETATVAGVLALLAAAPTPGRAQAAAAQIEHGLYGIEVDPSFYRGEP